MTAALLWAQVLGWLNDKLDRTLVMAISLALGLLGYCGMAMFGDPAGDWLLPASIILGIGQISVTQAAGTLLGQECGDGQSMAGLMLLDRWLQAGNSL